MFSAFHLSFLSLFCFHYFPSIFFSLPFSLSFLYLEGLCLNILFFLVISCFALIFSLFFIFSLLFSNLLCCASYIPLLLPYFCASLFFLFLVRFSFILSVVICFLLNCCFCFLPVLNNHHIEDGFI
jgi:hypothetical protein